MYLPPDLYPPSERTEDLPYGFCDYCSEIIAKGEHCCQRLGCLRKQEELDAANQDAERRR